MKNSMKMLINRPKWRWLCFNFKKSLSYLFLTIFLSQTQGSVCNVSNCQTHVGSDGRALPVAHGLLKHFAQPFFISRLDLQGQNNQLPFDCKWCTNLQVLTAALTVDKVTGWTANACLNCHFKKHPQTLGIPVSSTGFQIYLSEKHALTVSATVYQKICPTGRICNRDFLYL